MTPSAFRYARPGSLNDAVGLLGAHGAEARVLSGGQSLIPLLAQRQLRPRLVVDINRIPGLDRIETRGDHLCMGALVRQEQARASARVRAEVPGLGEALEWVANPVIRERGTVIGNLVANAPGAELPAVAIALGASFIVRDVHGERRVPASTVLGSGGCLPPEALVTQVLWPRNRGVGGFYEVARRDGHAPVVGALVSLGTSGCRVALCGVTAVGMTCPAVAQAIRDGFPVVPSAADIARRLECDLTDPVFGNDFVGSGYRRDVAPVVIQRAALAAARQVAR